jgi:hypothetical protein
MSDSQGTSSDERRLAASGDLPSGLPRVRFEPLRPVPSDKRMLTAFVGPVLWLVSLVVVSWVSSHTNSIFFGLALAAGSFAVATVVLGILRPGLPDVHGQPPRQGQRPRARYPAGRRTRRPAPGAARAAAPRRRHRPQAPAHLRLDPLRPRRGPALRHGPARPHRPGVHPACLRHAMRRDEGDKERLKALVEGRDWALKPSAGDQALSHYPPEQPRLFRPRPQSEGIAVQFVRFPSRRPDWAARRLPPL